MRWLSNAPPERDPVKHFPSVRNDGTPVSAPDVLEALEDTSIELEQVPSLDAVLRPQRLPSMMELESAGAQQFQALAIRLQRFQKAQHLKRLLITSSVKGEGKSVISANLAITLARRQRTLLIDGDLYQSGLREVLGSYGQLGLKDWWQGSRSIFRFLRRLDGVPLWYLSAGQAHEQSLEILQSQRLAKMLNELSVHFEWVIIDSPPIVPVADSSVWAAQTDGTLLIVKRGQTPKVLLQRALQTDNLKVLGIVTNEWEDTGHEYYSQYYKSAHETVARKAA